jgi:hypothetical protein
VSIYFHNPGVTHRYAFDWKGGAGGIMSNTRAATCRELGAADLLEAGYGDPNWQGYYQLQELMAGVGDVAAKKSKRASCCDDCSCNCVSSGCCPDCARGARRPSTRVYAATGDFMGFRLDGPEPIDPQPVSGIPIWDGLSDNEKILAGLAAGAGLLWWWKKRKRRRR